MLERTHLTKDEWDDLEPYLVSAEEHGREEWLASTDLADKETTPGALLLRRLRELGDEEAIRLFRAAETYQHELTRHDLAVAYLRGRQVGEMRGGGGGGGGGGG